MIDWQPVATGLVVLGSGLYLLQKLGGIRIWPRRAGSAAKAPDVPLSHLKRKSGRGSSSKNAPHASQSGGSSRCCA